MASQREAITFAGVAALALLHSTGALPVPSVAIMVAVVAVQLPCSVQTFLCPSAKQVDERCFDVELADIARTFQKIVLQNSFAQCAACTIPASMVLGQVARLLNLSVVQVLMVACLLGGVAGGFIMRSGVQVAAVQDEEGQPRSLQLAADHADPSSAAFWSQHEEAPQQTGNSLAELAAEYNTMPDLLEDLLESLGEHAAAMPNLAVLEAEQLFEGPSVEKAEEHGSVDELVDAGRAFQKTSLQNSSTKCVACVIPASMAMAQVARFLSLSVTQVAMFACFLGGVVCGFMFLFVSDDEGEVGEEVRCASSAAHRHDASSAAFWPQIEELPEQADSPLAGLAEYNRMSDMLAHVLEGLDECAEAEQVF